MVFLCLLQAGFGVEDVEDLTSDGLSELEKPVTEQDRAVVRATRVLRTHNSDTALGNDRPRSRASDGSSTPGDDECLAFKLHGVNYLGLVE